MQTIENIINIISKNKEVLFNNYPLTQIGVFGSYIRGEQTSDSDLDILIDYDHRKIFTVLDLIRLQDFLTDIIGIKVDIALKRKLKTAIGHYILKEVKYL